MHINGWCLQQHSEHHSHLDGNISNNFLLTKWLALLESQNMKLGNSDLLIKKCHLAIKKTFKYFKSNNYTSEVKYSELYDNY